MSEWERIRRRIHATLRPGVTFDDACVTAIRDHDAGISILFRWRKDPRQYARIVEFGSLEYEYQTDIPVEPGAEWLDTFYENLDWSIAPAFFGSARVDRGDHIGLDESRPWVWAPDFDERVAAEPLEIERMLAEAWIPKLLALPEAERTAVRGLVAHVPLLSEDRDPAVLGAIIVNDGSPGARMLPVAGDARASFRARLDVARLAILVAAGLGERHVLAPLGDPAFAPFGIDSRGSIDTSLRGVGLLA